MADFTDVRTQFPGLNQRRDGIAPIFLDGPAGTQVPQAVVDAIAGAYTRGLGNVGAAFPAARGASA